jgi:fibronectin type 3 domain-containing protein
VWQAPSERENGTVLSAGELAAYELSYYSEASPDSVFVEIGAVDSSYSLSDFEPGTYYFTISSVDTDGLKSVLSDVVTVIIDEPVEPVYPILVWQPPTERESGEGLALAELAAYELSYALDGSSEQMTVSLPADSTEYSLVGMLAGTYSFTIASIDVAGLKSSPSEPVTVIVDPYPAQEPAPEPDPITEPSPEPSPEPAPIVGDPPEEEPVSEQPPAEEPVEEPVEAPLPSVASLAWDIPTVRENGEPLAVSELAGYEIYYTTETESSGVIAIDNPATTEYLLQGLAEGTYYFSIAAIDNGGVQSQLSNLISVIVASDGSYLPGEPIAEEPVAEEPVAEEPVAEEPVQSPGDDPVAEEPVTEDPVAEDPTAPGAGGTVLVLSWAAPVNRVNGQQLLASEIAGYEIIYTTDDNQGGSVMVDDPGVLSYTLSGLAPATYYFTVVAIDSDGLKSDLSNMVSEVVVGTEPVQEPAPEPAPEPEPTPEPCKGKGCNKK